MTDISGRGVGFDVVRTNVQAFGGAVSLRSNGEGTCVEMRLPIRIDVHEMIVARTGTQDVGLVVDEIGQHY